MSFPETRHSLIQRIAAQGQAGDWREFLLDYWGPVTRFAMRQGAWQLVDAEDVAAETFQALVKNHLLARWALQPTARLRTLLCSITRNVLANRARVQAGRRRIAQELARRPDCAFGDLADTPAEQLDAFYAAWVEEVLVRVVEKLLETYHADGKGDYFRVLYGKVCEERSVPELAGMLGLKTTDVENYYRHARQRLALNLEAHLRDHATRYGPEGQGDAEFVAEWGRLAQHLQAHGGLEEIIRRTYEANAVWQGPSEEARDRAAARIAEIAHKRPE